MFKPKVLLSLIFLLAAFIIAGWMLTGNSPQTELEKAFIKQPDPQIVQERILKEIGFKQPAASDRFFDATSMHFGNDGLIYFGDSEEMVIRSFDIHANPVETYGIGEGNGPGEFARFFNAIFSDEENNLWVYDSANSRITIIDKSTSSWKIHQTEEVHYHVIPLQSGKYAARIRQYTGMKLYDENHNPLHTFDPLVQNPELWIIILQGSSAVHSDFSIIQSFYFTNHIVRYDTDGNFLYFRKPVEPVPLKKLVPEHMVFENGGPNYNFEDYSSFNQITSAISLSDQYIHLLISKNLNYDIEHETYQRDWLIDIYDIETGDYRFSYETPEPVSAFAVSETHLAAISEATGKLIIWEIAEGW
ncbi:MAG: hypothetical protein ACFCU6_10090 [Balneolaceae bacterium]